MKNTIPVFFATDDNYAPFLCVAIKSVKDNISKNKNYKIHILNNGLSEASIQNLSSFNDDNFTIQFDNVEKSITKIKNKLFVRDYYSNAIYYRLFIPTMFPEYNKAIYLDCDVIVKTDIAKMFNTDIGNNLLGAVADEAVSIVPEFQKYTNNYIKVDYKKYFNSGVLLMNLTEMRNINFESIFMDLIAEYSSKVAPDQDCLNIICKDRIYYFDLTWNKMPFAHPLIKLNDINIIHYNLCAKPWKYANVLYQEEYWKYAKQTNVYTNIKKALDDYTDKQRENDRICSAKLIELAEKLSNEVYDLSKFYFILQNTKRKIYATC